jgi:hypothetical protein
MTANEEILLELYRQHDMTDEEIAAELETIRRAASKRG